VWGLSWTNQNNPKQVRPFQKKTGARTHRRRWFTAYSLSLSLSLSLSTLAISTRYQQWRSQAWAWGLLKPLQKRKWAPPKKKTNGSPFSSWGSYERKTAASGPIHTIITAWGSACDAAIDLVSRPTSPLYIICFPPGIARHPESSGPSSPSTLRRWALTEKASTP